SRPTTLPPVTVSHQRMRQLIEFIEANLDQPLTLDAMAAQVGISPLYLARAFKAAVGQSPHQYVLARRIERAKELLRNTEIPIIDVALSVGFSSQSHLSHWMIRHRGLSPQWRQRIASAVADHAPQPRWFAASLRPVSQDSGHACPVSARRERLL